jgi:hypothetical protein
MTTKTTQKRPPAVAVWLFEHFACGSDTNAVLGDLAEQYVHKSRMWYWRQVLKGIPVSVVTEALGHKVIAAKAIVTGCIGWFVFLVLYPGFVFGFASSTGPSFDLVSYLGHPLFAWAALWIPVAISLLSPGDSTVFQLWIQVVLPLAGWTVCGWIVTRVDIGRTHRDLAPLFAGFILLLNLVFVIPGLTSFLDDVRGQPFGPNGAPFSIETVDLIAATAVNAAISVFGILLGGSLRRTRRGADMTAVASHR